MSTHMPGFQTFFRFLHHFVLVKLVASSIRVKFNILKVAMLILTQSPNFFLIVITMIWS